MASNQDDFRYESIQDNASVVKYLNALKEGFLKGKILLGSREKKILLEPKGLIKLDVKARKKEGRVKISIKCAWKESRDEPAQPSSLTIETVRKPKVPAK